MDDDAALMAELLAISNKSASSRFDDFDDDQKDPDPSPKPSPQATPRRKSSSNVMAKGRLASAQKAKDIMESMKKVIRSDESYFEETRVVDDNIWIVSQTPPDTPGSDRPRSAGRHAKSRSRNNSFSETAPESTFGSDEDDGELNATSGFQSGPNPFQGERGGAAEDADLLAELRAISSKASGSDRFGDDEKTMDFEPQAPPVKKEFESPPKTKNVRSTSKRAERSPPPWKKKAAMRASKKDNVMDKQDVESSRSGSGPVSGREEAEESNPIPKPKTKPVPREEFGFADKSGRKEFHGERGGAAEDDDLLAKLRAISMKNSSGGRFGGDDD